MGGRKCTSRSTDCPIGLLVMSLKIPLTQGYADFETCRWPFRQGGMDTILLDGDDAVT